MLCQTVPTSSSYCFLFIFLSSFICQSVCLNVLFVSDGTAGHLIPMFELAKAMKNHNVTFLTQQLAQTYTDLDSLTSPLFRSVYADNSVDALVKEKYLHQQMMALMSNHSILNAPSKAISLMSEMIMPVLRKTIEILMYERFDVIVSSQMVFGVPLLCKTISTPCVIQNPTQLPGIFDFNLPNAFVLFTSNELTQFTYRMYNVLFTTHAMIQLVPKLIPALYSFFQSLPQVPGPFYNTFTLKNLLSSNSKCLQLISMPTSFLTPSYSHHYQKYLGGFIDETPINNNDDNSTLSVWIKSKRVSSIVFAAFGSTSLITYDRMYNLINGLAMFLLQTENSFLLLAFHNLNYDTYRTALKDLRYHEYRQMLEDKERVWIEQGFVKQKWILQQTSVKIFFSHCGMGSSLEGLYFAKPIVCMPFNMDQFFNAISIENLNVGQSLFTRSTPLQTLLSLGNFINYTFTAESIAHKSMILWTNTTYQKAAERMSLEMKHAGGVKRAIEEIEFFVNLDGNLDRFAPFESTLWFYQRYLLDLLFISILLPVMITTYVALKCCRQRRKTKTD